MVVAAGCGRQSESGGEVSRSWNPLGVRSVNGVPVANIKTELARDLQSKTNPQFATADQWGHTKKLYAAYSGAPLWLNDDGVDKKRVHALVDALVNATTDGIDLDQYQLVPLAATLDTLDHIKQPSAAQLAHADLLLTTAYTALSEDYLAGQIRPATVSQSWHIDPQEDQVDSALVRSLRDKSLQNAIARMRPEGEDYDQLRRALADYRRIAAGGGWPVVPAGKALSKGDKDSPARLNALRARLRAEGYSAGDSTNAGVYDAALAGAVAEFQQHHAIGVDSSLGKETLDALNVSAVFRLAQIAANLERYRWLPRSFGDRYILVNVPAFRLEGYDAGKKTIEMKVIVGSDFEGRATPVFSDMMETVVFRPYWDVPPSIASKEFPNGLPADFEMSGSGANAHPRQRPGPKNALGLVKFLFPNDYNIYLHDTPNDQLFQKDVRAFSHGCIRVEKPAELAQWVLGWDSERVRDAMESGPDDHSVKLDTKLPVFISYMTAYVRDGQLWFGNDLYHRDDALVKAVANGASPSPNAVRGIEALRSQ